MLIEQYQEQLAHWPQQGRHILAQFDAESIYVYQAYSNAIADYALCHQCFGGAFSYTRMSWIKPNFLWMMFRAGWANKAGQERILAIRLRRPFFDELLRQAVPSTFDATRYPSHETWQAAVANSDVRLQWDPDHDPYGAPVQRRAVQLGVRGKMLRQYGTEQIISIEDLTDFARTQHQHVESNTLTGLLTPQERIYCPADACAAHAVGIDSMPAVFDLP